MGESAIDKNKSRNAFTTKVLILLKDGNLKLKILLNGSITSSSRFI